MSERQWKPGDVALDPESGPCFVVQPHVAGCPQSHHVFGFHIHYPSGDWNPIVDRLRPLVVIDPEDRDQVADVCAAWFGTALKNVTIDDVSRAQNALRSLVADPKPDEPQGLGAVVEDAEGRRWVRTVDREATPWTRAEMFPQRWRDLNAVRVLSEGWSE